MTKEESKKLKEEVIEKFNEIAIKLQDIDDDNKYDTIYDYTTNKEIDNPNYLEEAEYFITAKNVAESLATGEVDDGLDYYTSSF